MLEEQIQGRLEAVVAVAQAGLLLGRVADREPAAVGEASRLPGLELVDPGEFSATEHERFLGGRRRRGDGLAVEEVDRGTDGFDPVDAGELEAAAITAGVVEQRVADERFVAVGMHEARLAVERQLGRLAREGPIEKLQSIPVQPQIRLMAWPSTTRLPEQAKPSPVRTRAMVPIIAWS